MPLIFSTKSSVKNKMKIKHEPINVLASLILMSWERLRERRALENILGIAGLVTLLAPLILLVVAFFAAVTFAYLTALIWTSLGIAVWVFGNKFLRYLEGKIKSFKE